MKETTLH